MAKFKAGRGLQASYDALANKDPHKIHICVDTGNVYLGSQVLSERDKNVNSENGQMGYKVINNAKSLSSQLTEQNTIYEIRDVFDCGGTDEAPVTVNVPRDALLLFRSGKIKNCTLNLDNAYIGAPDVTVFDNVKLQGKCRNIEYRLSWFGVTPIYSITTTPLNEIQNTEVQATATKNTEILNNVVDFLNANGSMIKNAWISGGTLVVDRRIWINKKIHRIYNFSLNCVKMIRYIGDDFITGGVLEVGGYYLNHTIRIENNNRQNVDAYPQYATDGVFDADKAYDARKDSGIIGVLVRDSNRTTINIENVRYFTTGVMVAGGRISGDSSYQNNFVSYERFTLNNIQSCYRSFVVNLNAGWVTECKVEKGRMWGEGSDPFTGHSYAIVFEKTSGAVEGCSNMIFDNPCVEGNYCALYINNVNLKSSEFRNVRDEGCTNRVVEAGGVTDNYNLKSKYISYSTVNQNKILNTIVLTDQYSADYSRSIRRHVGFVFNEPNSSGTITEVGGNTFFLRYSSSSNTILRNRVGGSYIGTVDLSLNLVNFHAYTIPAVLFDNSNGSTEFAITLSLQDTTINTGVMFVFFDANGNEVRSGIVYPTVLTAPESSNQYRYYANLRPNTNTVYKAGTFKFTIPSNVKTIAFGTNRSRDVNLVLHSGQTVIEPADYCVFSADPYGCVNTDFNRLLYFNSTDQKFKVHVGSEWVEVGGEGGGGGGDTRPHYGPTANRPVLTADDKGIRYYDTDLLQNVYWNGGGWNLNGGFDAAANKGSTANRPSLQIASGNPNAGFYFYDTTLNKPVFFKSVSGAGLTNQSNNRLSFGKISGTKSISNPLPAGAYCRARTTQGKQYDTCVFYFCKEQGNITDPNKYIRYDLGDPYEYDSSSNHYWRIMTDIFVSPDPSEYPYLYVALTVETEGAGGNRMFYIDKWENKWITADGFTAAATSGASASRPTLDASDKGFSYYDTTLGKSIVWNGSAWNNTDGTSLDGYSVTKTGVDSNITLSDGNTVSVGVKEPYMATLVPASGHTISNVTVTMGGVDVTNLVYNDGVIYIPAVIGDLVITATTQLQ